MFFLILVVYLNVLDFVICFLFFYINYELFIFFMLMLMMLMMLMMLEMLVLEILVGEHDRRWYGRCVQDRSVSTTVE